MTVFYTNNISPHQLPLASKMFVAVGAAITKAINVSCTLLAGVPASVKRMYGGVNVLR